MSKFSVAASVDAALRAAPSVSSPYGLGIISNNLQKRPKRIVNLYLGYMETKEILNNYRLMVSKVDNKFMRYFNESEMKFISVPANSRWNSHSHYFWKMRKAFLKEVEGLKSVKMLTLTFDEKKIAAEMPDWWLLGVKPYAAVFGSKYLNTFLKRLREYRKKAGQRWNYLGYVLELQESGMVHFHVLFYGRWIADIKVLKEYWDGSKQDAGVDIAKGDNVKGSVRYITKYITKMKDAAANPEHEKINSVLWYFGVRLFNLRQVRKGPGAEPQALSTGKWHYDYYTYGRETDEELAQMVKERYESTIAYFEARGRGEPDADDEDYGAE